ncbi:hypothetical protein H8A97_20230 [Bradyrhizobium sp. Arg62]|uniref:hypothetical protein n=1 Tax=Bradyrhizobium TaxID=374 RepID=UPI001E5E573D|nr:MULTISPECIES: hypothetical protein [Bradyrhizobium]MCC8935734.1 hypothetical protein [Bradyrhizobium ivorense]MCC8947381.1 hypothetical protein [Bradyrhizobium brasilense]
MSEFIGKGNPQSLLKAIDHLRTFRSTGVPIAHRRAKRNPHPQDVVLINPEGAVLMEPRRVEDAAAQHSAWQEMRLLRDDQPAPSVFVQEHVAFDPAQMSPGELHRVLDHLDDQSMASSASVDPEGLLRLEHELRQEIQGGQDNQPAPLSPVGPDVAEQFTFEPEELRRLLDDEPAPLSGASSSGLADQ